VILVLLVLKVNMVPLALKVILVPLALKARLVPQASKVRKEMMAAQAQRDHKEILVCMVLLVHKVTKAHTDQQVTMDDQV